MLGKTNVASKKTVLEELTITAGTSDKTQTAADGKGYSKVTVSPTPSQAKSVTPGASQKTVTPDAGKLLSQVTVSGDTDLVAGNIRKGIDIFGVTGTLVEGKGGVDFGEVTLASYTAAITVSHNLGKTPTYVALVPKSALPSLDYNRLWGFMSFGDNTATAYGAANDYTMKVETGLHTKTESKIEFGTGIRWAQGTYVWFALA